MSDADSVEIAARRLTQALDALEAATERRREADRAEASRASQIHALNGDRARLANEFDEAAARARALEDASREVAQRIDRAIETIRGVLETDG